jgi:molybdopterin molybdotransferase
MRATLTPGEDGVPVATPFGAQDSSMMQTLARADCLLIREPFAPALRAGTPCSVVKLAF